MASINRISCIIGTAGHIDHGKTSLVKALTGMDTDRLLEEKKRGVSIDLGFAYLDIEDATGSKARVALVDVPGHERFIKNMLAGTTGIDMVVFVVAADDGVMPQTREHLDIVHLLGVRKGIFAITKSDLVKEERIDEVRGEVNSLINDTVLKGSPVLPVSAVTGGGMGELKALIRDFALNAGRSSSKGFFRLPVDRSFPVKGFGTVVTGTVASGAVRKGEDLVCYPNGKAVKVRGIQSLHMAADSVSAGERAALNISGVSHSEIGRGMLLVSPGLGELLGAHGAFSDDKKPYHSIDCLFEFTAGAKEKPLKNRAIVKVHHMTDESLASIKLLGKKDAATGGPVYGRLILKKPLLMLRGDRFILRDPSINSTVGGGTVEVPYFSRELMPRISKATYMRPGASLDETLLSLLPEGGLGFEKKTLALMLNIDEGALVKETGKAGEFLALEDFILNRARLDGAKKKAIEALSAFHRENPLEAGMKEEGFTKVFKAGVQGLGKDRAPVLTKEVLDDLVALKLVKREGSIYSLASHTPASNSGSKAEEAVRALFSNGLNTPLNASLNAPTMDEIRRLPFSKSEIDRVMNHLQRNGIIVKLKEGSYISGEAVNLAKVKLAEHIKAKGAIKASEFRDILGCGRKLAIEILEYFDKERVTLRQGDIRTLR